MRVNEAPWTNSISAKPAKTTCQYSELHLLSYRGGTEPTVVQNNADAEVLLFSTYFTDVAAAATATATATATAIAIV